MLNFHAYIEPMLRPYDCPSETINAQFLPSIMHVRVVCFIIAN